MSLYYARFYNGDFPIQLGVGGSPDFAHAPFAELRDDSEVCDRLLRAHRVVQGMVSLSGRITGYAEVLRGSNTGALPASGR